MYTHRYLSSERLLILALVALETVSKFAWMCDMPVLKPEVAFFMNPLLINLSVGP